MMKVNDVGFVTNNNDEFEQLHWMFFKNNLTWFNINGIDVYVRCTPMDLGTYTLIVGISGNVYKTDYLGKLYLVDCKTKPTIPPFEYLLPNTDSEKWYGQLKQLLSKYDNSNFGKTHNTIKNICKDLDCAYNNGYIK